MTSSTGTSSTGTGSFGNRACRFSALLISLLFALSPSVGRADAVKLSTLDWCPYTCESAPDGGVTTEIVRRLMAADDTGMSREFLPWQRAVSTAKEKGMVGYYPEYPGSFDDFILSKPIGVSPLGLAHLQGKPANADADWLSGVKVGVVAGYLNGKVVDEAIAAGRIKPDEAKDDATNLRKLAAGRVDVVVIDKYVMAHLLRTVPDLKPLAAKLAFSPVLEELTLHIAFNKSDEARAVAARFDARAEAMNPLKMQAEMFAAMLGM